MKLILILFLLTINVFGQNVTNGKKAGKGILISSSQISEVKTVKINAVEFDLVVKNKDTIYMQTNDAKFKTKEGYSVGRKLSELPSLIKKSLIKENGWGYFYTLASGWSIGFCEGKTCTENYPNDDAEIKWIFKRK